MNFLAIFLALSMLYGCGASNGTGPSSSQAPSQQLSVTPATIQIRAGATQQFFAKGSILRPAVPPGCAENAALNRSEREQSEQTPRPCIGAAGETTPDISWSVNGIAGGNPTVGTIDAKGLYRAPSALPNSSTARVTASVGKWVSAPAQVTLENPIPVLTAVSPNAISVGSFSVTVSGSNFVRGAEVIFAGNILQTSFKSPTQLVATGIAGQSQIGRVEILVKNPNPGSATSAMGLIQVALPPDISQADVVVDAAETVSETGKDDMAAAKNIYASASAPESDGGLYPDWRLISSQFTMKRMRNINGLGDCALDGNGNLTGCSRLNNDLANMKHFNLTPHVIVGQWAPSSIAGNPRQWGSSQWAQYDALCYAIVNYVVNQYTGTGFSEALFEVENEIDTTTDPRALWLTTNSSVAQGDPSRFTQFDAVYSHWAKAVAAVAQENPNKKVKIAAPATGFWTVYYGSGQLWQNQVIEKYAALGLRLDVISLHIYEGEAGDLAKYAQSIRNTLNSSGYSQSEIWISEWGASDAGDSYFGAINSSQTGAAWAVYFLLQALKGTVTGGSFLEVRDNQGHDTAGVNADMYGASWDHVENGIEYPKPISNAFSMVGRMTGTRKLANLNPAKPNLYALASSDSKSASVIVANYNYLFDYKNKNYSDQTTEENVSVALKNLPFNGTVTADRYLIDAETSNLNYWVSCGKTPPSVQLTQLQKVESFSANSVEGTVLLPARGLGQSAVSLWVVHQ